MMQSGRCVLHALIPATIALWASVSTATAENHLAVGVLQPDPTGNCLLLINPEPGYGGPYLLEDYGSFVEGDTVMVIFTGGDQRRCVPDGPFYPYLTGTTVVPRRGFDFGCGRLDVEQEYGCRRMYSDTYGSFLFWSDSDVGVDGDTIHVVATLRFWCSWIMECEADYCLEDLTVTMCPDTMTTVDVLNWGRVKRAYCPR